jgi:hypothetical protein
MLTLLYSPNHEFFKLFILMESSLRNLLGLIMD